MTRKAAGLILAGSLFLLPACGPTLVTPTVAPSATAAWQAPASATPAFTETLVQQAPAPVTPAAPATTVAAARPVASVTPAVSLCSPLEDIGLEELDQPDLMKNPFEMPRPGLDEGHPGVDFAYWSRGERVEMLGLGVKALLPGRTAGVIQNRSPYGYAVIIETPLEKLPPDWTNRLPIPAPSPTTEPAPNLLCPPEPADTVYPAARSLYVLYGHLNRPPEPAIDQAVACGQTIGEVGTTGRSVNPHLHLEVRVGPSGATFTELAHYDNSATENEMRNYCTWRVSGLYHPLDPLALIRAVALQP